MTVKCEHCGSFIPVKNGVICPTCHRMSDVAADALLQASQNKSISPPEIQTVPSFAGQESSGTRRTFQKEVWIMWIVIAVMVALLIVASQVVPRMSRPDSNETEEPAATHPYRLYGEAAFKEWAYTDDYRVTCYDIQRIQEYPKKAPDGYMFVAIHFLVTNLTDKPLDVRERIVVHTNGIQCEQHELTEALKGFDTTKAEPHATIEGTACFMIPERVDYLRIQYGSNILLIADGVAIE